MTQDTGNGATHTLSHASNIRVGSARRGNSSKGISMPSLAQWNFGAIGAPDTNGLVVAEDLGGADDHTLATTIVNGGTACLLTITSAGNASGCTFTITGTDIWSQAQVETVVGANAGVVSSVKAFRTVTSIAASADALGNIDIGWGLTGGGISIGLPYAFVDATSVLTLHVDGLPVDAITTASLHTVTAGVTTDPQTATTGDPRGLLVIADNSSAIETDGSLNFTIIQSVTDHSDEELLYGVANYAG